MAWHTEFARNIFKDPFVLSVMLEERRSGASLNWLGQKYQRDHSTIMFHCRKYGIIPEVPPANRVSLDGKKRVVRITVKEIAEAEEAAIEQALTVTEDGPINRGKSYKEYLKEAMERSDMKHYFTVYRVTTTKIKYNPVTGEMYMKHD